MGWLGWLGLLEITKVPYLQHYYDTGSLDKESFVWERVTEGWSCDGGCQDKWLAAAEMFWEQSGNALESAKGLGLRVSVRMERMVVTL